MTTTSRATAAVVGALALTAAACSASSDRFHDVGETPSATVGSAPADMPVALTPVITSAVSAPVPVAATDGKTHLAYELMLTNTLDHEVTLTSVAVRAGDQTLLTLTGDTLTHWTRALGKPTPTAQLAPGQAAIVWLDVALDESAAVPAELTHAVGVEISRLARRRSRRTRRGAAGKARADATEHLAPQ
jgi:hypothetical protein